MTMNYRSWHWWLGCAYFALSGALGDGAFSQIQPDNTLGAERSVVTPNEEIKGARGDRIDGGAVRGTNLFHSFQEFNVNEGRGAYFANPSGVENILSRVTGGNVSQILGTLGVLGKANLFLINPNGIIFGSNARLDVEGSFLATSANAVRLGDTGFFSASDPQMSNLLTIQPSALFFTAQTGGIVNRSQAQNPNSSLDNPVGLQVPNGQTLALVGGNVALDGGILTAAGGRIELGSVAGAGEVSLSPTNSRFGYNSVGTFGNIQLQGGATVDASGTGGGDIQIQGAHLDVRGSDIIANTTGSEPGGEVFVRTTDTVTLSEESELFAQVDEEATRNGGDITIKTRQLLVEERAKVSVNTNGSGDGGDLTINASESVHLTGEGSKLFAQVADKEATGDGGNITIDTRQLLVEERAKVSLTTMGSGDGGDLKINASESVQLIKRKSDLSVQTEGEEATGDGGNITIDTRQLLVKEGAKVSVTTNSFGAGGDLTVNASESVQLIGLSPDGEHRSGLFARAIRKGDGGTLRINTQQLVVRDGARASATTMRAGDAGNLIVNATESVELIGTANKKHSELSAETDGRKTKGNPGRLEITTPQLLVQEGARIAVDDRRTTVNTQGTEDGNIQISADYINLDNGTITAETTSNTGGNITLQVQNQLLLQNDSEITTSVGTEDAGGDGGDIEIYTNFIVGIQGENTIKADANQGNGGKVKIEALGVFGLDPNDDITATSDRGPEFSGTVEINALDVDPTQVIVDLPIQTVEAEVAQVCTPGGSQESEFIVTGRGGLPSSPYNALESSAIEVDWVALDPVESYGDGEILKDRETASNPAPSPSVPQSSATIANSQSPMPKQIVEAQGWVVGEDGKVILTAKAPAASPHSAWQKPVECNQS